MMIYKQEGSKFSDYSTGLGSSVANRPTGRHKGDSYVPFSACGLCHFFYYIIQIFFFFGGGEN